VIPNFVPDQAASGEVDVGPYLERLPREPFLLFVGALGRLKGLHVLLQAYRLMLDPPPLVLIGYPMPETDAILGDLPPNVRLLGQWPPEAVHRAWQRALMGIVPSICQEACPTVVIEAMKAAIPVVATRMGGIPDLVVDGETGLLVSPGDAAGLAAAMTSLLANPSDVARLGQGGHQRSLLFTASAVVPRIESAYREVVETGTLRPAA
jgi:glycosyltransferase involved in cell wall biosynthesis